MINEEHELITDHVPSKEDLVGLCSQMYENDPKSIFYKRELDRPKLGFGWLIRLTVLFAVMAGAGLTLWFSTRILWLSIAAPWILLAVYTLIRLKAFLIFCVKAYQRFAPAKLRERCRYEPSCSHYMIQAIEKYGAFKGFSKGFRRWCRCKPPHGGYDYP